MSKNRNICYVVNNVDIYVEIETDGDKEYYSIQTDGYTKDRFKPLLDALLSLQTEDDKEIQEIMRGHHGHRG